jgi:hypothetical protein
MSRMRKPWHVVALLIVVASFAGSLSAQTMDAEKLERQMWADMKAGNSAALEARLAPAFQSVHPDGARGKAAELALMKGLKLGDYTLTGFKVTRNSNQIIVTYSVSVAETIDGKRTTTAPAMRQSVWAKNGNRWQWIAHANLKPL